MIFFEKIFDSKFCYKKFGLNKIPKVLLINTNTYMFSLISNLKCLHVRVNHIQNFAAQTVNLIITF